MVQTNQRVQSIRSPKLPKLVGVHGKSQAAQAGWEKPHDSGNLYLKDMYSWGKHTKRSGTSSFQKGN
jgi:hypothetical protein